MTPHDDFSFPAFNEMSNTPFFTVNLHIWIGGVVLQPVRNLLEINFHQYLLSNQLRISKSDETILYLMRCYGGTYLKLSIDEEDPGNPVLQLQGVKFAGARNMDLLERPKNLRGDITIGDLNVARAEYIQSDEHFVRLISKQGAFVQSSIPSDQVTLSLFSYLEKLNK